MTEIKGGIRVWDFKENKAKTVSEQEAESGIAAGQFSLRKDVDIPVVSPDGTKYTINSNEASEAFKRGWRLERPEEVRETFDTAKEKAVKEVAEEMPVTAFGQGFAKTATFGLSDAAIQATGMVEPEFQKAVAEENPIASIAGEVAGALPVGLGPASAVARGTAALGTRAATSPIAQRAVDFAADGLAYGMGESISDLALGNPEEVASNLILGGGLGGVLGGATAALAPVAKASKDAILKAAEATVVKPTTGLAKAVAKKRAKSMGVEGAEELIESGRFRETLDPEKIASLKEIEKEAKLKLKLTSNQQQLLKEQARELRAGLSKQKMDIRQQLREISSTETLGKQQAKVEYNKRLEDYAKSRDEVVSRNESLKQQYLQELDSWKKEVEDYNQQVGKTRQLNKAQQKEYAAKKAEYNKRVEELNKQNIERKQQWRQLIEQKKAESESIRKATLEQLDNLESKTLDNALSTLNDVEGTIKTHATSFYEEGLNEINRLASDSSRISDQQKSTLVDFYQKLVNEANDMVLDPSFKTQTGNSIKERIVQTLGKIGTGSNPAQQLQAMYEIRRHIGSRINWNNPDRKLMQIYNGINKTMEEVLPEVSHFQREIDSMYQMMSGIRDLSKGYKKTQQVLDPGLIIKDLETGSPSIVNPVKEGRAYDKNKFAKSLLADPQGKATFDSFLMKIDDYLTKYGDEVEAATVKKLSSLPEDLKDIAAKKQQNIKPSKVTVEKPELLAVPDKPTKPERLIVDVERPVKPTAPTKEALPARPTKDVYIIPEKMEQLKKKLIAENASITDAQAEDLVNIMAKFGGKSAKEKAAMMSQLKEVRQFFLENPQLNTLEKYAHLIKTVGGDSSVKEIEDLLQLQKDMSIMDQLENKAPGRLADLGILASLGLGGADSGLMAMAVVKAAHLANSPKAALAVIPQVERFASNGRKIMESFSTKVANTLTGKAAARHVYTPAAREEYQATINSLIENQDPATFQEKMGTALEPLSHAPNVQLALMNKMVQTQQYLSAEMPKNPLAGKSVIEMPWEPSQAEKDMFMRKKAVVENPSIVLDKITDGTITPEEVTAFKTVHPQLFEKTKMSIVEQLAINKGTLPPYNIRVALSTVFDLPIDPTLDSAYIVFMQESIASYPQNPVQSNKSMSKLDPQTFLSDAQQVTMK